MDNNIFDDLEDFDENQAAQLEPINQANNQEFNSTLTFKEMDLDSVLLEALHKAQFENPSPVQSLTIPKALLGCDILCQAKSGTGKTAVFVLGILQTLLSHPDRSYVVTTHTKELVDQITEEFRRFSDGLNIVIETFSEDVVEGDTPATLRPVDFNVIVVAINKTYGLMRTYDLKGVTGVVVDECDAIVGDEGMTKKFERLHGCLGKGAHVMMYTATLSARAKKQCLGYLKDPFIVAVDDDSKLKLTRLRQFYIKSKERHKLEYLQKILCNNKIKGDNIEGSNNEDYKKISNNRENKTNKSVSTQSIKLNTQLGNFQQVIVFCKQTQNVLYIEDQLDSACGITPYMSVEERGKRLREFKERKFRILSTTDMLSRGIDVQAVDCVVNYDMPKDPQTYLHRIARAGRFDTTGTAISFINGQSDEVRLNEVIDLYEIEIKDLL